MELAVRLLVGLNKVFPEPKRPCSRNPDPQSLIEPTDPATIEYIDMQIDKGNRLYDTHYRHHVDFENKLILDLGCGLGGLSFSYSNKGCKSVTGVDIKSNSLRKGYLYIREKYGSSNLHFASGNAASLPFRADTFDIVIANDFMEHVSDPLKAIQEITRVLKENGSFFFEFPPYYSPRGYHMLYELYTPWCHVFFPKSTLAKAAKIIAERNNYFWVLHPEWERFYIAFLNHLKIIKFISILLTLENMKLKFLHFNTFIDFLKPFAYIYPFNEFVVSNIVCILQKQQHGFIGKRDIFKHLAMDLKLKLMKLIDRLSN